MPAPSARAQSPSKCANIQTNCVPNEEEVDGPGKKKECRNDLTNHMRTVRGGSQVGAGGEMRRLRQPAGHLE